jgi:hypothetical protein
MYGECIICEVETYRHPPSCYVFFTDGNGHLRQHNTAGNSLFECAMNAIRWFNDWYGPRPGRDTILIVHANCKGKDQHFQVRAERVVQHFGLNPADWLD